MLRIVRLDQCLAKPTQIARIVALAESAGCELWTADGRLYRAVRADLPCVRSLTFGEALAAL